VLCRVLCALLFVAWTAEWPLETDQVLYCGLWRSPLQVLGPLFVSLPGLNLFPWHLMVLAVAPVCLLWPGHARARSWLLDAAILVSLASVAATFVWGWVRGGSPYNAYFQLWRFLVGLLFGLMLHAAVRRPRDLRAIGWTVLAAAVTRAGLAIYFYWFVVQGNIDPPPPYMTTHDDTLLFVAGVFIVWSWAVARPGGRALIAAFLVSGLLVYAMVVNNRRLAWIELLLGFAVMYVLLFPRGWRVHRWVVAIAPIVLVYLAIGWGQPGPAFAPARALATAGSDSDASSLARQEEVRNLLYTLSASGNPLLGTGWGVPYQKVTSVYSNFGPEWWQYLYLPHNSLLAVAVFGGLVGLVGMWLVVPVGAFLAARGFHGAGAPLDRAAAMSAVCVLPAYSAQCYGDIGIQSLTGGLLLGVAVGVAGKVGAWARDAVQPARPAPPRRPAFARTPRAVASPPRRASGRPAPPGALRQR
jgi:hypothetical protein